MSMKAHQLLGKIRAAFGLHQSIPDDRLPACALLAVEKIRRARAFAQHLVDTCEFCDGSTLEPEHGKLVPCEGCKQPLALLLMLGHESTDSRPLAEEKR